jgi:hypothetical protein
MNERPIETRPGLCKIHSQNMLQTEFYDQNSNWNRSNGDCNERIVHFWL